MNEFQPGLGGRGKDVHEEYLYSTIGLKAEDSAEKGKDGPYTNFPPPKLIEELDKVDLNIIDLEIKNQPNLAEHIAEYKKTRQMVLDEFKRRGISPDTLERRPN